MKSMSQYPKTAPINTSQAEFRHPTDNLRAVIADKDTRTPLICLRSFQKSLQLITVKAHDNLSVNHGDLGRHVSKLRQFVQRCLIRRNLPIRELHPVL